MAKKEDEIQPIQATFDQVVSAIINSGASELSIDNSKPDMTDMITATHKGILPIGGLQLECYVLEDGRRVFHKRRMAKAIGLKSEGGNAFMKTLSGKNIGSEIDEKLWEKIENPIVFNPSGPDPAHGYEAGVLVDVCKALIRSREAGKLSKAQEPMALQASAILSALAKVGIVSLIDEATGYQTPRSPGVLRLLVQAYIEQEKREWEKKFPDDFYIALNQVYGSDPYVRAYCVRSDSVNYPAPRGSDCPCKRVRGAG